MQKEHEQERQMMNEQRSEMLQQINEEQEKEEANALLRSAAKEHNKVAGADPGETRRLTELTEHLAETCASKDEIMMRMFDYICTLENAARDSAQNLPAIETALQEEAKLQSQHANRAYIRKIEELQSENYLLKEELSKHGRKEAVHKSHSSHHSHGHPTTQQYLAQAHQQTPGHPPQAHGGHAPHPAGGYSAQPGGDAARRHAAELQQERQKQAHYAAAHGAHHNTEAQQKEKKHRFFGRN
eukprot:TRINITY_DN67638_c0_g2_i1.p1 TRINITY_DN67638_c0_g2~~TRINITY_DN67638_c0_g2_i1.p1  ORF type:complete len:250 (+),score=39.71 TRINITY_DN67638_c0_g2_i1:27-752(+)